jgi:signal transduction histidine kinase
LRKITATTQQISAGSLHQRLALGGPGDELTQLADTIDGLLERLDGSFEAQRRFVANASHELRTPLAMMRTFLDVAVAKPKGVPPQTRALDADLRGALDHADRLLESFLVLAQAQYGELGEQQPVAVEQLVTEALDARAAEIAAKQIDLHTALQPARVVGSETLLARMVENVIENAIRHNQHHGSIDIGLTHDVSNARLVVDSGGEALDERAVAQLARPFRRLDQDRTGSQNGHGLGLSIIAAITAAHDGTLQLQARSQGGLRVQITLPIATAAQLAGATR